MSNITFDKMCDRCFRMLGDSEQMFAFKFVDDVGAERVYKGHGGCLNEIVEVLTQLYGVSEGEKDEQKSDNSN